MRKTKTEDLKVVLLPANIHQALKLRAVKDRKHMKEIPNRSFAILQDRGEILNAPRSTPL